MQTMFIIKEFSPPKNLVFMPPPPGTCPPNHPPPIVNPSQETESRISRHVATVFGITNMKDVARSICDAVGGGPVDRIQLALEHTLQPSSVVIPPNAELRKPRDIVVYYPCGTATLNANYVFETLASEMAKEITGMLVQSGDLPGTTTPLPVTGKETTPPSSLFFVRGLCVCVCASTPSVSSIIVLFVIVIVIVVVLGVRTKRTATEAMRV